MILFLLSQTVYCQIYRLEENQADRTFSLVSSSLYMLIDINNKFSSLTTNGTNLTCSQTMFETTLECEECEQGQCKNQFYYPDNTKSLQVMMKKQIDLVDVYGDNQTAEFVYSYGSQDVLGLGSQRGQKGVPQNPFVTDIFSLCFGDDIGFAQAGNRFEDDHPTTIKYESKNGLYSIQLESFTFDSLSVATNNYSTSIDTIQPYIKLPSLIVKNLQDKMSTVFGCNSSEINGKSFIVCLIQEQLVDNLPNFSLTFQDQQVVEIQPKDYLYLLDGKVILGIIASDLEHIVLGLPFFRSRLVTIDQRKSEIQIREQDCQRSFTRSSSSINYSVPFFIFFVIGVALMTAYLDRRYQPSNRFQTASKTEMQQINLEDDI